MIKKSVTHLLELPGPLRPGGEGRKVLKLEGKGAVVVLQEALSQLEAPREKRGGGKSV